ncbi:MAG: hypothetical protein ACLFQC_09605 [Wenzhouxiangella sp.]
MIRDQFSLVDLPQTLDPAVLQHLGAVRVAGQALRIRADRGPGDRPQRAERAPGAGRSGHARHGGDPGRGEHGDRRSDKRTGAGSGRRSPHSPKAGSAPGQVAGGKATAGNRKTSGDDKPGRGRPVITRAQRKAGHGARSRFKK